MTRSLSRCLLILFMLWGAPPAALEAQWSLGALAVYSDFKGGARDPSGLTLEPSSRFEFGIGAARDIGRWQLQFELGWAPGHLSSRDSTGETLQLDVLAEGLPRYRATALFGRQLTALGAGRLSLMAGPTLDLWQGDGDTRPRVGGQVRLVLEAPLGRLLLQNYLGYSLSGSPFNASEFTSDIARPALQAISLGVEIRMRL